MRRMFLAFAMGLCVALAAGWAAFPRALYHRQSQPLEFRHKTHAAKSGSGDCATCHVLRDDGAFMGVPSIDTCAGCHADAMGVSKAEAKLVNQYVKPHQEVGWLVYSRQPANVRFSHAIHVLRGGLACTACHGAMGESDKQLPYRIDRISGYSADLLSMSACENCHSDRRIEVGCLGCHQ